MKAPSIPENEVERLEELARLGIIDTPYEEEFDDIVKLASKICETSISTITLVESSRQWFKAKVGLEARETARDISFCGHVITTNTDLFEVEDALKDETFFDNPLVTGNPNIRFYAAVPLISTNGFRLGTLCVIDSKPKSLTKDQIFALKVLGTQVMKLLELRILNRELEEQRKKQQQQLEMQNKIISIIAHDVRGPVASLKNIIELTNNNILSEAEARDLTIMAEKQLDGTLILLSDLLEWGQMQFEAKTHIHLEKIHLHSLVAEKIKHFEVQTSLKGNKLINLVDADLLFSSDINAVRFILRNLISNANKFTSNGAISIYAHKCDNKILITVNDTGIGMTEHEINKIFDTETKYTTLGTNKEKGTGLGLTLSKDFAKLLNGSLTVESEHGKGTTVSIELPA